MELVLYDRVNIEISEQNHRLTGRASTLPETTIAPKNQCLEDSFPFGFRPILRGYVCFREGRWFGSRIILENNQIISKWPS